MTLPGWLFSGTTWIVFWVGLGAFALWAVWAGTAALDDFEDICDLFDQDDPRNEST